MAQVGTDDDQGFVASPEPFQDLADFFGFGVADDERHQGEVIERLLQERQMHLETVFELVRTIEALDAGQVVDGFLIDRNPA